MLRPQLLMSSQQVVAQAFVGEGITVLFDAVIPKADLKNRVIHLRPMPEEVSEADMVDIRADCDHELGHFLYTDMKALQGIRRTLVAIIAAAIEDGYVERLHSEFYLGIAENLAESNARHFEEIRRRAKPSVESQRSRAITALMILSFGGTEEEVYAALLDDVEPYIAQIREWIPLLQDVQSTWDSRVLAEQIADTWRWDSVEEPKPQELEADDHDESPAAPVRPQEKEAKEDQVDRGPIDTTEENKLAKKLESGLLSIIRKKKISKMDFRRSRVYRAKTDRDVVGAVPSPTVDARKVTPEFIEGVRQIAGPLRRRLLMEFRGPGPVMQRHQRRGLVDQRSLHKIPLGCFNVFEARVPDLVIDRDVTLMVDCSGSMVMDNIIFASNSTSRQLTRLWVAAQTACACSLVLDLLGVTHEVLAWTTTGGEKERKCFERVTPLWHMIVKPASAAFHRCIHNFTKLALMEEPAENIDGEAILWGAQRLAYRARRAGKRPLMIVFSDGEPLSSPEDPSILAWHLESAVKRVERAGIPTLGVGIQTDAVKRFYPRNTVINDLSDLIGSFYRILRSELRHSRKIVH